MKKDLSGKSFENLSATIFRSLTNNQDSIKVEEDVLLDGQDGKRQIDVLMTSDIGPCKVRTIIECRDRGKVLDITHIDGLHSKMQDVGAHKSVIVSRKGFSKKAKAKANRLGISLFTLSEAKESDWQFVKKAPVFIKELFASSFSPSCEMSLTHETTFNADWNHIVNDINLSDLFQNLLLQQKLELKLGKPLEWSVDEIKKPHFVRDASGSKVIVTNLKVTYEINESLYFGYLSDLPGSHSFNDVLESKNTMFIKSEALSAYRESLQKYEAMDDLPAEPIVNLVSVACPNFNLATTDVKIESVSNGGKLHYTTSPHKKSC
jgi:hypothetical protein